MKNSNKLLKTTTAAVMTALVCVLTMAVRIPSPTKGYMNLGDCAVLFGGWLLGPLWGTLAGGIGSALADLLAGYPVYIPGTLIIKSLMALTVSLVPFKFNKNGKAYLRAGFIVSSAFAEALMATGYYLYEAVVVGIGFIPAFAGVSGNIVQGIFGAAGAYFLVEVLSRTDLFRIYGAGGFVKRQTK